MLKTQVGLSNQLTQTTSAVHADTDQLMEKMLERNNLGKALKKVESNKGAPGIDGMKTEELLGYLKENWARIKQELLEGTYKPSPVRRVEIPKPDGGMRLLGIPTVLDRFIQQALLQVLTPIFDPTFSEHSYGFRPGKSAHQAVLKAQEYIKNGKRAVVDIDLEKFFDRVNHNLLMARIEKKIADKRICKLIRRYLKSGVMINGCHIVSEEGTPQGGPISPLLANIMLDDLDKELTKRNHSFVRYADDCNIYVASIKAGQRVFKSISNFIEKRLKLKVNESKSAVDRPWHRKFLGLSFTSCSKTKLKIAIKVISKFKQNIRELTKKSKCESMEQRIKKLNAYLQGWGCYFCIAETRTIFDELDRWIRRRMRAVLLKQWKKGSTKRRELVALGLSEKEASLIATSVKKYWRLARTRQVQTALGLAYWRDQGLKSLVARYDRLHAVS